MIAYRDATPADLAAVDALFRDSFTATFAHLYAPADLAAFFAGFTPAAWAAELARPDLAIRLAEDDGAAVGFAKVSAPTLPVAPAGPAVELRQLYLAEAAKGTGVGAALLGWAIDHGRARGAGELFLSVYVDNGRARRFYERHGFTDIGRYTFTVGTHEDEDRLMRLAL
jgi:ribosomal protein S18 acetylase RimI-like enzyme